MTFDQYYPENAIRTHSGKVFDLKNIQLDSICIEDIAHALSHSPRFGGHLPGFYSVAQHCCFVTDLCPDAYKIEGLLHDASEAYIGDMPSPFKKLMPDFKQHEFNIMEAISMKYSLVFPMPEVIKKADLDMLSKEWDSFFMGLGNLDYWEPDYAKKRFLEYFEKYKH